MPLYKYVISEYQESIIINKQTRYIGQYNKIGRELNYWDTTYIYISISNHETT